LPRRSIRVQPAFELFGSHDEETLPLRYGSASVIGQVSISVADVGASLEEDYFRVFVKPSQSSLRGGAAGDTAYNHVCGHGNLSFPAQRPDGTAAVVSILKVIYKNIYIYEYWFLSPIGRLEGRAKKRLLSPDCRPEIRRKAETRTDKRS
jgi:hypothetical protein